MAQKTSIAVARKCSTSSCDIYKPPLHAAATSGSWKAISRLLEAGADLNCLNDQGQTPIALAFSHADQSPDVITELLEKTTVDWDLPLSQNILFTSCVGGNKRAISAVLGRLNQDRPKEANKTVRRLLPELLGELCSSGPAANSTTFSFLLPYLHSSSKEVLSTAILFATIVAGDDAELAQALVDIDPKNAYLRTPGLWAMMHFACRYGRIKIARVLLANGAPAWAKSERGVTALGMARKYLEDDILERFVDLFRGYEAALEALRESEELQGLILAVQLGILGDGDDEFDEDEENDDEYDDEEAEGEGEFDAVDEEDENLEIGSEEGAGNVASNSTEAEPEQQ